MLNENGGSKTDTLIKLVLVFFLSLLSFSVGTFVGKQFSDSQHKMAELETTGGEGTDRSAASIPPDATKPEVGQAISEDEITKLSEEFIKKEKAPGAHDSGATTAAGDTKLQGDQIGEEKPTKKTKTGDMKKAASVHDEIAEVSKRIAKGEKVETARGQKSRVPSSLPVELATSSLGKFTVQISSHPTEDEAKKRAQELKEKGLSAFYVPAVINAKTWYRVSVGLFENKKAALEYREKIVKDNGLSTAIVQKIVASKK